MIPNHEATHWIDAGALGVTLGALLGYLPTVAAILSVVWMALRVYSAYLDIKEQRRRMKDDE